MDTTTPQKPPGRIHLTGCGWIIALPHVAAVNCFGRDYDGGEELHIYLTGQETPVRVRADSDRDRFFAAWDAWEARR